MKKKRRQPEIVVLLKSDLEEYGVECHTKGWNDCLQNVRAGRCGMVKGNNRVLPMLKKKNTLKKAVRG